LEAVKDHRPVLAGKPNVADKVRQFFLPDSKKTFTEGHLKTLEDAVDYCRRKMSHMIENEPEDGTTKEWLEIIRKAKSRDPEAKIMAIEIAGEILGDREVPGYTKDEVSYHVYRELWGLSMLEEVYCNPEIDEIRIDSPDDIQVVRRAKAELTDLRLEPAVLEELVRRLPLYDNVRMTDSNPWLESMLLDGNRLTATKARLTPQGVTSVLRKHGTFHSSEKEYLARGTLNKLAYNMLKICAECQLSTLVIGPPSTGKTTLIREMSKYFNLLCRIVTIESDAELKLRQLYAMLGQRRSVVEFEEHPELGLTFKEIFPIVLRYSPGIIIMGEIRTLEELEAAINAAIRGHSGCISSVHYLTIEDALFHLGMMLVQSGRNLTSQQAQMLVASAWDIAVLMFESSNRGIKKMVKICEVINSYDSDRVEFNPLIEWQQTGDDFWTGDWVATNQPGKRLMNKMRMYGLTREDCESVGWSWEV
jgi:pilus assembly protein CpaF